MVRQGSIVAAALGCALALPADASPPDPACGLEDPAVAEAAPRVPRKPREVAGLGNSGLPVVRRARTAVALGTSGYGAYGGALAGKTVYVSAGHGWTWADSLASWRTQRGNTHDLVEDFISAETVDQFLLRYLVNMGAHVVPVRESDLNANLDIVDDGDEANGADRFDTRGNPQLSDEGTGGYGIVATPIVGDVNPFAAGGALAMPATAQETARVTWTFDVPDDGEYNVYVAYVQGPDRASDAHYIVNHTGGETHFYVDQRRHGSTWVLLGRFHFEAGIAPDYGSVALANDSADVPAVLSVDAVRIGGGVGVIDRGGGANGRPMFENNARYNAQLSGAPPSVYDYTGADGADDVGTRSRFAAWDHEEGEDAVYVSWHTNAPDPARGTTSFAYGPSAYGPLSEFSGVPGSLELMDAIHSELIADIRAGWESDWQDRGQNTAYFGEINPNHNPEMPAALFEIAFHDTAADAEALRDPRFRRLAARAIAQGIAKYFHERDGRTPVLPPEPPTVPMIVQGAAAGTLELAWRPPVPDPGGGDEPTGYVVYLSSDGRGFDAGQRVDDERLTVTAPPGAEVYARITAVNDGGESFPTPVVGARVAGADGARVLVVGGFDRLDRTMLIPEDLSAHDLAIIERALLDRINDGSHAARHGAAIAAADVSFDGAHADAVAAGDIDLTRYDVVDWFVGEESVADVPLIDAERQAIEAFLAGGGSLLLSGSEIAWALVDQGLAPSFLPDALHVGYVADDADSYAVLGAGAPFADMPAVRFDDFGPGSYDADYPDVLAPEAGGATVLRYESVSGAGAATLWSDAGGTQHILVFGFPFETIAGADARADVMARLLGQFGVEPDEPLAPDAGPDVGGGGGWAGACACRVASGTGGGRWPLVLIGVFFAALWRTRTSSSPKRR